MRSIVAVIGAIVFLLCALQTAYAGMDTNLEQQWTTHFKQAGQDLDQRSFDPASAEIDQCMAILKKIREDMSARGENALKVPLYGAYYKLTTVYANFVELNEKGGNPVKAVKNKRKLQRIAGQSKRLLREVKPILEAAGKTDLLQTCQNCENEMQGIFVTIRNIPSVGG